ncbi:MAG: thymidine phosphorylase [Clostridia bacterium]|nr:thymidine phosphorylase [Clostridia bacterium]
MYNIIRKKRDGGELSNNEILAMIKDYTAGKIPDYQMSAFLMSVFFNGLSEDEINSLTEAMAYSGDQIDLSCFGNETADKHSTGGVGDKTSLITVPIAASLGCKVAKMSGRGLGHTGGTVDKLESIPGYKTTLTKEDFITQTEKVGIAICGQSANLAPADKKLYALRDVTATVDSIGLIASSIMSKKIAAGAKNIVLDVKVGSGAFMKNEESARTLSKCMVNIGKSCGRKIRALITNMDIPLGNAVGNSLEVIEAIDILKGDGDKNLRTVSCALAAQMVSMVQNIPYEEALKKANDAINSGKAFLKFCEWIEAQGGDASVAENTDLFKKAALQKNVFASKDGYITHMDAEKVGSICVDLGGGRKKKDDVIDHSAGIILIKKTGDSVKKGDVIAVLHTNDEKSLDSAIIDFESAVTIEEAQPQIKPLIYDIVE